MAVDAGTVRELRERTGLPMMECKKALEKTGGDVERAIEELRKAGAKAQEKLAGRKALEGRVASYRSPDGRRGVLAALRCETEPVSHNEQFVEFASWLPAVIAKHRPADEPALLRAVLPSGKTVDEALKHLINQLRENISLGRFASLEGDHVAQYIHFDNKKGGMVALRGGQSASEKAALLGKDLCMHVVFSKPRSLSRAQLDPQLVAKETEILLAAARNDPKNAKKPDNIIEKIVDGQLQKRFEELCFLEQPFIRDDKLSVEKHVQASGLGLTVAGYAYVATDA